MRFNFLKTLPPSIKCVGVSLCLVLASHSSANAQSQVFANWSNATIFRLGNVSCTAALGASVNQGGALLADSSTLDSVTNYPSTWFTPTPPVGAKWSNGNLLGVNASQEFTVTCLQSIPTPRMHTVNLDTSQLELTTSGAAVTRLSGNNAFVVSGNILNSDYGVATNAGCDTNAGGNPNGACGTVEISGSHSVLSFTNRRTLTSGDGWQWTLSANAWTIGGSVSGLSSGNVVLQNNLGDNVTVSTDGSFIFPSGNIHTTTYSVTVLTQPTGQTCTVTNATGTATADKSDITVTCTSNAFTVGGSVTGLAAGQSVVLLNNAGNSTTVNSNTSFTFSTAINSGGAYAVTVGTQPTGQTCTVTNGSGNVSANVTNVTLTCTDNPVQPIPTLGEWAMIFMASLMAMFGIRRMRRTK